MSVEQGFGYGSGLDPDSIRPVDPDPDPGGQKCPTRVEKFCNFMFLSAGCSLLRPEGFFFFVTWASFMEA